MRAWFTVLVCLWALQARAQETEVIPLGLSASDGNYYPFAVDTSGQLQITVPLAPGSATAANQVTEIGHLAAIETAVEGTLTVTASSLPLPTGASTAANQSTEIGHLADIKAAVEGTLLVDGSGFTQPVTAVSLPLPTGAATSADQTTGNASLASIDGKTPALVSGRVPVDGSGVTQPVSGTVTALQGSPPWLVDGSGVTQPISAAALPLPSGASTAARQDTGNGSLASIDGKLASDFGASSAAVRTAALLGNAGGAADFGAGTTSSQTLRAVIVTDQTAVAVSQSSQPLPTGAATSAKQDSQTAILTTINTSDDAIEASVASIDTKVSTTNSSLSTIDAGIPAALGQVASASSMPVVIASDQSAVPISAASLPLPTGAATAARQDTGNTSLSSIDTKLTSQATAANQATEIASLAAIDAGVPAALGQTTMASSMPVAIASNQSAIPASQSGTWNITNVSGTVSLPTGAATETTLAAIDAGVPAALGQTTMSASMPVTIASNQSAVPASQSGTWNITNVSGTVSLPTGASTAAKQPALGTAGTASADVITIQGIASMTAVKVDGSAVTQPISMTTTAIGSSEKNGKLSCASLTSSYATVVATTFVTCIVHVFNSCDNTWLLSLDGGTTQYAELEYGDMLTLDLCASGKSLASSVNIQAKHAGAVPAAGTIRISLL